MVVPKIATIMPMLAAGKWKEGSRVDRRACPQSTWVTKAVAT